MCQVNENEEEINCILVKYRTQKRDYKYCGLNPTLNNTTKKLNFLDLFFRYKTRDRDSFKKVTALP